ncbi:C40 family peptidase [Amycolatopsis nivea]
MKIVMSAAVAIVAAIVLIGGIGQAVAKALLGSDNSAGQPSQAALSDIPTDYLGLYQQAASACPGLDWSVLAAIGKVETDHGRSELPGVSNGQNFAGAGGPMQFLQATFNAVVARHPLPASGSTPPSRYNPHDAVYAAAYYLCDSGAPKDMRRAIFAYNRADWYVNKVLTQAKKYEASGCEASRGPNPAATAAITFACNQRGLPYLWGGNGPAHGDNGFDCSGLTTAAYNAAGVHLPRTAQTQYNAGSLVPPGQQLLPGDLVFYGTPGHVHHVGLYIGSGKMVHAPDFGHPVQVSEYRWKNDDFLAASRPAS